MPEKVVVGLSGGVDSSVAAYLLKEQGYDVSALFMINWHDTEGTLSGDCPWHDDLIFASLVAEKLGIPFHKTDLSKPYRERVVNYMFSEYEKGRTPNPDVLCNREIKFDLFIEEALKLGADKVATGHYCSKEQITSGGRTVYRLLAGADQNKDQSYFLCQLSQKQLERALFPLGGISKEEVRKTAAKLNLPTAGKKDSQGICFVGKVDLPLFLQQKLQSQKGEIIEIPRGFYRHLEQPGSDTKSPGSGTESPGSGAKSTGSGTESTRSGTESTRSGTKSSGKPFRPEEDSGAEPAERVSRAEEDSSTVNAETLESICRPVAYLPDDGIRTGSHNGAWYFTVGQRKGLNVGGRKEPVFVIATDTKRNIVYTGEGHSHPGLNRRGLFIRAEDVHWIRDDIKMQPGETAAFMVRVRYRQPLQNARLFMREDGLYIVFENKQRGIAAGQFAAWYRDGEILGSGIID
ncbi:MAG: tRNA 2-thiouridine(34) synthase MnmA [Marinilabiliales bacterium]|nr:MAG: tRNA 2-thiouridine(34) synthase MnmA [Marinilabiliales bacterium]